MTEFPVLYKRQGHYHSWLRCCKVWEILKKWVCTISANWYLHVSALVLQSFLIKKQTKTKNKRFGKLTTVCYVQNHSPRSGESVLPLWKALMLQPRATVQRSKHCGSWHPYISFYQTCDSWPTISHCTFHSVEEECEEHQRKSKFESKNYSCTPPSLSIPAQPFLCDTPLKQNISLRCHRYWYN